jgi:hypothetical protein
LQNVRRPVFSRVSSSCLRRRGCMLIATRAAKPFLPRVGSSRSASTATGCRPRRRCQRAGRHPLPADRRRCGKIAFRGAHEVDRPDTEPTHAIDVSGVSPGGSIHRCHAKQCHPQNGGNRGDSRQASVRPGVTQVTFGARPDARPANHPPPRHRHFMTRLAAQRPAAVRCSATTAVRHSQ